MRVIPILLLLSRCAMAANPPVNFTFNAGVTCSGICISPAIQISAVTTDAAGNTYFTGNVNSTKLPTTPNVFQPMLASGSCAVPFTPYPCSDAFVVKLDPQGDVAWATYLGGNGADVGTAVAVDADGNVFIAGSSTAENGPNTFPITSGAAFGPPAFPNGGVFVSKLSADGSRLLYSTFVPGGGSGAALAIDSAGAAYVAFGSNGSLPIPTTPGAFQPTEPANPYSPGAVVKLNASGSAMVYATYLAGSGVHTQDFPTSIAVDSAGNAVVAGSTSSTNFPVTPGAFQTKTSDQELSGFVSKLNSNGTGLIYSTYLGGSKTDQASVVKLDTNGDAYVFGNTNSPDFPVTSGSFSPGTMSGFVTELSADGSSLVYSIFVPYATTMNLDAAGSVYVAGTNPSAAQTVFIERLAPNGVPSGMETLGGPAVMAPGDPGLVDDSVSAVAVAPNGSVVVSGTALSGDFPGILEPITQGGFAHVCSFFIDATVMNAANYTAGIVAPGEIVAILGHGWVGPTVSVYFNGYYAPQLYYAAHQINVQVPWEVAGLSSAKLTIQSVLGPMNVSADGPYIVSVAPASPGVFYVTNSDGTLNSPSNPASRGDFVSIYGTGGGVMNPAGVDGAMWPLSPLASLTLPVSVTVGGANAGVIYAGSAPTLLSGFFQVNVGVPTNAAPSNTSQVVVSIGSANTTVAIAIR